MANAGRKQCPNCGARNASDAKICVICETPLVRQRLNRAVTQRRLQPQQTNFQAEEGEDDLLARNVASTPLGALLGLFFFAVLAVLVLFLVVFVLDNAENDPETGEVAGETLPSPSPLPTESPLPTNTRPAPLSFPSVTPLPPTATATVTEGPCIRTAEAEDTLYGLAWECGHRDFSIVDVIVEVNEGLTCRECLREGQTIEIPWPTPTGATASPEGAENDGVSQAPSNEDGEEGSDTLAVNEFGTPDPIVDLFATPTLRPGLQWHTVGDDDSMISIAARYGADAKVLSDINPEIDFAQCDFSERYGGPQCTVLLYPGQRVRVPAPTPTQTLSPTPSGSETATPTITPTFNVPAPYSPLNDAVFDANQIVTLRWSASGTLAENEVYLIRLRDEASELEFEGRSADLFFVLPDEWRPADGNVFELEWIVSIAVLDEQGQIQSTRQETEARRFVWQG